MKQAKKKLFKQCFSRKGALGLLIAAIAIIVVGCKKDESVSIHPIQEINKTELNFRSDAGTSSFRFTSMQPWTAQVAENQSGEEWCRLGIKNGPSGSFEVPVSVTQNLSPEERKVSILLKSGDETKVIVVTQKQKDILTLSKRSFVVEKEGGIVDVELNENTNGYEVVMPQNAEWVTQHPATRALATHQLSFRVAPNNGDKVRTALITIKGHAHGLNETLSIVQRGEKGSCLEITAGGLERAIKENLSGRVPEELVILGEINGDDINYIHQYANQIQTIDLLQAKIVSGGAYYGQSTVENEVPKYMFYNMKNLQSIILPEGVTKISDFAFYDCNRLENVVLPSTLKEIGLSAFRDCFALKSIQLPNSVTSIGELTFYNCTSLKSIVIPNSVTSIGVTAFADCTSLKSIKIPNSVTSIGDGAFCNCTSLKSIVIPDGVEKIGCYAFYKCSSLSTIEIPNGVTSIGDGAFGDCTSLTSIKIPNRVKNIDRGTFIGCTSLTSIEIPNSVTRIEWNAFAGCTSLKSIEIPNSVTMILGKAFNGCTSLKSIEIPNSVTRIERNTFKGCSSLTSIEIPNSVESIGNGAFNGCTSLTSIKIPNSVTSIGEDAFNGCSSLASIEIPNSVTRIENAAFKGCTSLTSIKIPNSVTSIYAWTFAGCSSLTSIVIPDGVWQIEKNAFDGCTSLTSIKISNSVTSIGMCAFRNCKFKEVVCYGVTQPKIDAQNDYYKQKPEIDTLYVPKGSKRAYESSDWKEKFDIKHIVEMDE